MSTIGIHSSSRAFGRSTTAAGLAGAGARGRRPERGERRDVAGCDPRLVDVEEVNRELGGGIRVGGRQRRLRIRRQTAGCWATPQRSGPRSRPGRRRRVTV